MNRTNRASRLTIKPIMLAKKPVPNIVPNRMPAKPPIIMPFRKLPPLKNPRCWVPAVVVALDLFVVELLLTLSCDFFGVWLNDFLPELNERGLASAAPVPIGAADTAKLNANTLITIISFFHMALRFLLVYRK